MKLVFQHDEKEGPGLWVNQDWKPGTPGTFAVIIGVSVYPHLKDGAAMDAEAGEKWIAEAQSLGQLNVSALTAFRLFDWLAGKYRHEAPLARCWLLLSPTEKEISRLTFGGEAAGYANATLENCRKAIRFWKQIMRKTPAAVAAESRGIFFFSGHGLESTTDQQLLLPTDYLSPPAPGLNDAIVTSNLRNGLRSLKTKQQLFFIDACRNDYPEMRGKGISGAAILTEDETALHNPMQISPILYATGTGQQAFEHLDPEEGLSIFGQALLDGLAGRPNIALDCDKKRCAVGLYPLQQYLKARVLELLKAAGGTDEQFVKLGGSPDEISLTYIDPPKTRRPRSVTRDAVYGTSARKQAEQRRRMAGAIANLVNKFDDSMLVWGADEVTIDLIAEQTDQVESWTSVPAVQFYLRDWVFHHNVGPYHGARMLQHALGLVEDGIVGPKTRAAIASAESDSSGLLRRLHTTREQWERGLRGGGGKDLERVLNRLDEAMEIAKGFPTTQSRSVPQHIIAGPPPALESLAAATPLRERSTDELFSAKWAESFEEGHRLFGSETVTRLWQERAKVWSIGGKKWLDRNAIRISEVARDDDRDRFRIQLEIAERSKSGHWLQLVDERQIAHACMLPGDEDMQPVFELRMVRAPQSAGRSILRLEAQLGNVQGPLGRAAATWRRYTTEHLAAALKEVDADELKAILAGKFESPLAATIAALVLLRANRLDRLPLRWMMNLATEFPYLPDGVILFAERRLRERLSRQKAPEALVEAANSLLLMRERGLPRTSEAFGYAIGLIDRLKERDELPGHTRTKLRILSTQLDNAMTVYRPGGLFASFSGFPVNTDPGRLWRAGARKE
jgi:hypothetical protein